MRLWRVLAIVILFLSCEPVAVRILTLTFDPAGDSVTIAATTRINTQKEGTPEAAEAQEQRDALLAERDEWARRFQQANPETESVTFERTKGMLDSVERQATVSVDDLQKFFFDTPITITTTRGEGWLELAIYAGASTRATAEQRRIADKILTEYSERAVRYFHAVRSMYRYLDESPDRAEVLFTAVFAEDSDPSVLLSDRELSLVDEVRGSIVAVLDTHDLDPRTDLIFDLVYNPFPARMKVLIHGPVLAVEGFEKADSDTYEIKTLSAPEAVASLEGRWIAPDPIGFAEGNGKKNAAELASMIATVPRRTEALVTRSEVAAAIVERMRPAPRYRLRFTTKPRSRAS